MNTLALVPRFQEKLGVSRGEAIVRVIGFILVLTCSVALVTTWIKIFPFVSSFTQEIPLLPVHYVQVQDILDGEITMDREGFLRVAGDEKVFVAIQKWNIAYLTKVGGVSYRYNRNLPIIPDHLYFISRQEIVGGLVIREMERSLAGMIIVTIILPALLFLLLLIFASFIQAKHLSGFGEKAVYAQVWEQ